MMSSAEKFVRKAALRIGLLEKNEIVEIICSNLRSEYVFDLEQLSYIDSYQWKAMNAPIGLVATVNHQLSLSSLSLRNNSSDADVNNLQQSETTKAKTATVTTTANYDKGEIITEQGKEQRQQQQQGKNASAKNTFDPTNINNDNDTDKTKAKSNNKVESSTSATSAEIEEFSEHRTRPSSENNSSKKSRQQLQLNWNKKRNDIRDTTGCADNTTVITPEGTGTDDSIWCLDTTFPRFRAVFRVSHLSDILFPFDHAKFFKRGMLHSMSNIELKQTVINMSELWFVFHTILLGTCIELWGGYPLLETSSMMHGILTLIYNCLIYSTTITCVFGVSIYSITIFVASAVHVTNFKKFYLLIMPVLMASDMMMMFSWYSFFILCLLYFHGWNEVIINDNNLPVNNYILTGIVSIIFTISCFFLVYNINLVARLAFHCGLLGEKKNNDTIGGHHNNNNGGGGSTTSIDENENEIINYDEMEKMEVLDILKKIIADPVQVTNSYRYGNFSKETMMPPPTTTITGNRSINNLYNRQKNILTRRNKRIEDVKCKATLCNF